MKIKRYFIWHYLDNEGRLKETKEMKMWKNFESRDEAISFIEAKADDFDWACLVLVECWL